MQQSIFHQPWRFINHSSTNFPAIQSFAYDDTFCQSVGQSNSSPIMRAWVHPKTIVLGIQDSRLPYLQDGISYLEQLGFHVIVRNSGGLAVVLDEGILNISLLIKEEKILSIDDGYELMYFLIKSSFKKENVKIDAKEIVGSYCPGSYDLSIDGKKFAGISQRRMRGGIAVQIYLCVNGSGSERAELIGQFYQKAAKMEKTKFNYPTINPKTMASLSELLEYSLTPEYMLTTIVETMEKLGASITPSTLSDEEREHYCFFLDRMEARNKKALEQ